jgi:hypothetical protein
MDSKIRFNQERETRKCQKQWKLEHEKERGKDEPTHLLLLVIQWNGMESLQQDTNMHIDISINTVNQKFIVEKRTLMKFVRIFKEAPRVEILPLHQCLVLKIARLRGFCSKFKKRKEDN